MQGLGGRSVDLSTGAIEPARATASPISRSMSTVVEAGRNRGILRSHARFLLPIYCRIAGLRVEDDQGTAGVTSVGWLLCALDPGRG